MRLERHARLEQRRDHLGAKQRLEARVVGMRHQRDAGRQQLRTGRVDVDRAAVGAREPKLVIRAAASRDPRARPARPPCGSPRPTASAPRADTRCRAPAAAGTRAARRAGLPCPRWNRSSPNRPTDPASATTSSNAFSSSTVSRSHNSMKFGRDTEIACLPGFSGGVNAGSYGSDGVAPDAEVVLDATLGRQAVVVPAHRIEHSAPAHAVIAGQDVGVGIGEDVSDVQRAADGGRRACRWNRRRRARPCDRTDRCRRPPSVPSTWLQALPGPAFQAARSGTSLAATAYDS